MRFNTQQLEKLLRFSVSTPGMYGGFMLHYSLKDPA